MNKHRFNYKWNLADGYPESNGLKVFGTFICGGGSTMGYKLAGFEHLGGVEIDPKLADVYKANHNPKLLYNMDIRKFNELEGLPSELYNLDILDGSPPCSSFSMAGNREKDWGKNKQFREGQANQILDDLVYIYCDTIIKLKPKVFILENVKGIIQGNAKVYAKNIVKKMTDNGYKVQVFLLNAASMGVPQKRERVFFIGHKKEFDLPKLKLSFNEDAILFSQVTCVGNDEEMSDNETKNWYIAKPGQAVGKFQTYKKLEMNKVSNTIVASNPHYHPSEPRRLNYAEEKMIGTYPLDYNFRKSQPRYLIGMSVPPIMTAQIATEINNQSFKYKK